MAKDKAEVLYVRINPALKHKLAKIANKDYHLSVNNLTLQIIRMFVKHHEEGVEKAIAAKKFQKLTGQKSLVPNEVFIPVQKDAANHDTTVT